MATRRALRHKAGRRTGTTRAGASAARSAKGSCARCSKRPSTFWRTSSTERRRVTTGHIAWRGDVTLAGRWQRKVDKMTRPETEKMLTRRSFVALATAMAALAGATRARAPEPAILG